MCTNLLNSVILKTCFEACPPRKTSVEDCYVLDLCFLVVFLSYLVAATQVLCDEYFIPSLRFIGNALRLSPDVEGATLMAMGSATPELFTSLIAVYLYADDVALNPAPSTIVGSGMFNMTFVLGAFVIVAQRYHPQHQSLPPPDLNSCALHRDVAGYIVSVTVLYVFYDVLSPQEIGGVEGLCLIMLWVLYIVVLLNSDRCSDSMQFDGWNEGEDLVLIEVPDSAAAADLDGHDKPRRSRGRWLSVLSDVQRTLYSNPMRKVFGYLVPIKVPSVTLDDSDDELDFAEFPLPNASRLRSAADSEFTRCFLVFCLSVLWMSAISYLLLSAVSTMGDCLNVSASTMGLTVIAIGSSLPDTLSAIILAKRYGQSMMGMVLSNCCSSNIFNLCFVMGTTFTLKHAMHSAERDAAGFRQNVDTEHAAGFMMIQIFTALLFLLMMHWSNMRLRTVHGVVLIAMYAVFIVIFVVL